MIDKALEIRITQLHLPEGLTNMYFADSWWSLCVYNNIEMEPQVSAKTLKLYTVPGARCWWTSQWTTARGIHNVSQFHPWERRGCEYAEFPQINRWLGHFTATDLKGMKGKWHRTCYESTCNSGDLERARVRQQKVSQQGHGQKGVAALFKHLAEIQVLPMIRHPTSRSAVNPFNAKLCFFCQEIKK